MNRFYNDIKPYGNLLVSKHTKKKPVPVDIDDMVEYGLYWINNYNLITKIPNKSTVIMSTDDYKKLLDLDLIKDDINILSCHNPRNIYANIIYDFYPYLLDYDSLNMVNNSKNIGFNVLIGGNVKIGENVKIGNNVIIYNKTTIGNNVIIGDNVVIGSKGVAYDEEKDGKLTRFPQIGGVIIGDNVEIDCFCDIKRGALKNTIISNGVKIGAYNNIGHNVFIGKNTFISNRCTICGSSKIGDNCTLWVKSTIKHKIHIGNNTIVGSNTYVNKNYKNGNLTLVGIPAKKIKQKNGT
jgi:acetyltransferase-like isoleucine patch superfamily enzyme